MKAHPFAVLRLRIILDCILLALLILIAVANYLPVEAKPELRPLAGEVVLTRPIPASDPGPASASTASQVSALDDATLAAMIAAENAALLPQFLHNLPLAIR